MVSKRLLNIVTVELGVVQLKCYTSLQNLPPDVLDTIKTAFDCRKVGLVSRFDLHSTAG